MRRNKYSAQPVTVDGIRFDSKREAARYVELKLLLSCDLIADLKLQPAFPIEINGEPVRIRSDGYPNGRRVIYRADFSYFDRKRHDLVVEDVKGFDTPVSRLKRALVEAQYKLAIDLL